MTTTTTSTSASTPSTDVGVDAEMIRALEAALSGRREGSQRRSGVAARWARDRTGLLVSSWGRGHRNR